MQIKSKLVRNTEKIKYANKIITKILHPDWLRSHSDRLG